MVVPRETQGIFGNCIPRNNPRFPNENYRYEYKGLKVYCLIVQSSIKERGQEKENHICITGVPKVELL
jgi:hypothetical protein